MLFGDKQQSLAAVIIPCKRTLLSFSCAIPSPSAHVLNCWITDSSALHNFQYTVPYVFANSGLSVSLHLTLPISRARYSYSRPWSTRTINCSKELWTYQHCLTGLLHWKRFRSPSTWKLWMCWRIKTRLFDDDTVHTDALSSKEGALTVPSSNWRQTVPRDWNQCC